MTTYRLMDGAGSPVRPGNGPSTAVTSYTGPFLAGVLFSVTGEMMWLDGYYWWVTPTTQSTAAQKFALWNRYGTASTSQSIVSGSVVTSGTLTAGAWNYVALSTPLQLAPGGLYVAATGWTTTGGTPGFPDTNNEFGSGQTYAAGIVNGPLTAWSDLGGSHEWTDGTSSNNSMDQGLFSTAGSDPSVNCPNGGSNSANFWMDVLVDTSPPSGYSGSYRVWPNRVDLGNYTNDTANNFTLGMEFSLSSACTVNNVWFYSPSGVSQLPTEIGVYNVSTTTLVASNASPSWSGAAGSGWVKASLTGSLSAGVNYKVVVLNGAGTPAVWNGAVASYWSTGFGGAGLVSGPITVPDNAAATSPGQSSYNAGATIAYPNTNAGPYNYGVDIEVTPATGVSGAAALSGSGSLTAGALVTQPAAAALSGSGSLGAQAAVMFASAAPLSGTGTLAATRSVQFTSAAVLSGTGTLTSAGVVTQPAAASLSGSGTLTAARTVTWQQAVALAGTGTLAALAVVTQPAAAALSGSGTLAAVPSVQFTSACVLSGTGSLAAAVLEQFASASALAGTGTLTAAGLVTQPASAALSGSGSLGAGVLVAFTAAAPLSGSGTLTATALVTQPAGAGLSGSGTLTAAGSVSGLAQGSAALSGTGALAAGVSLVLFQGAALSGAGSLTVSALVTVPASSALSGSGVLAVAASATVSVSAVLSGQGTVTAAAIVASPTGVALTGAGSLTAGPSLVFAVAAVLAGTGTLTVAVQVITPVTEPSVAWSASPCAPRWRCAPSLPRWRVVMAVFLPIAAVSLECVNVTWNSDLDGTWVDPTGQTDDEPELEVQFAFPVSSGVYLAPAQPATWYTGSWLQGGTGKGYVSQCLVGPGAGVITFTAGLYDVWSEVSGSPEAPRKFAGVLTVF